MKIRSCILVMLATLRLVFVKATNGTDVNEISEHVGSRDPRRFFTVKVFNNECTSTTQNRQGVCLNRNHCHFLGGRRGGSCAYLFGTCCIVEKTCGGSTKATVSYFTNPTTTTTTAATQCSMTVRVTNRNVCQLRLDFDAFNLAQPTNTTNAAAAAHCVTEYFTVSPAPLGAPILCGENTGQHMYIPIDTMSGGRSVTLRMNTVGTATWRIRVTQIDCATNPDQVAPAGCLQYFQGATGTINSFNFKQGMGPYPPNSNYAICIQRSSTSTCSISVTAPTFRVGSFLGGPHLGADSCDVTSVLPPGSHDYLLIPAGVDSANSSLRESMYCGNYLETATIRSPARGPIVLTFVSDNIRDAEFEESFRLNYAQTSDCV